MSYFSKGTNFLKDQVTMQLGVGYRLVFRHYHESNDPHGKMRKCHGKVRKFLTIAYIFDRNSDWPDASVGMGIAACSNQDNPSKSIGREIATKRAIEDAQQKKKLSVLKVKDALDGDVLFETSKHHGPHTFIKIRNTDNGTVLVFHLKGSFAGKYDKYYPNVKVEVLSKEFHDNNGRYLPFSDAVLDL